MNHVICTTIQLAIVVYSVRYARVSICKKSVLQPSHGDRQKNKYGYMLLVGVAYFGSYLGTH